MVMTTVGVIVGGITMNPIVLGVISGIGVVIQGLLKLKNYEKKIEAGRLAQGRYQHVLNQIESFLRGEPYGPVIFTHELHWVDDLIADFCLIVEKLNGSSRGKTCLDSCSNQLQIVAQILSYCALVPWLRFSSPHLATPSDSPRSSKIF